MRSLAVRVAAMAVVILLPAAALASCGRSSGKGAAAGRASSPFVALEVRSPDFVPGGALSKDFSCDGAGKRPALQWSGSPAGVNAYAIVVDDPDAPSGTFTHWTAWDLRGDATSVSGDETPTRQGTNSGGRVGWLPPCPPKGASAHHYRFNVYALRAPLGVADGASPSNVESAIRASNPIAQGRVVATYARP